MPAKKHPPTTRALTEYRRKRDFAKTAEPAGHAAPRRRAPHPLHFVIQKHAASRTHFDLRLELDGVMKSWAIPKGPSLDPSVKRLAIQVEDHPIEYNSFEGTIPEGEYGGGTVMLWDRGTYEATNAPGARSEAELRRAFERGTLDITLHGERLRGAWTLVRTRRATEKPQWLLIKRHDADAGPDTDIVATALTSVATGRTMDEIARGTRATHSTRPARSSRSRSGSHARSRSQKHSAAHASDPAALLAELDRIERSGGTGEISFGRGASLELSGLDKVFFPELGYTKGDVMRYYVRIADAVLPVLADRPLVLKRSPDGLAGETFFQQTPPEQTPPVVRVETIERADDASVRRVVGGDLPTLLYAVQLGCISMDPWLSRIQSLDAPDLAVLDLDPGPRATFDRIVEVAQWIGEELTRAGLHGAIKTSGSRGIHIVLPLPARTSYDTALALARAIAHRVAAAHPKEATIERAIKARPPAAVYVDFGQNAIGKSVASAYSVRAKPGATVSTPLDWSELGRGLDPHPFTIETVPDRLATVGDIWSSAMRRRNTAESVREAANLQRNRSS
ncbi:MAG: non-homologous end-joining DNA ligase [Gemmatimonadaceae bacterium]|nr:non-homologous end-joining DNA ligase [Gemmatimonadaceae bacterium]